MAQSWFGKAYAPAWVRVCLALYLAAIGLVLLLPVSYSDIVTAIGDALASRFGALGFGTGWIEFIANILMFLPLGMLLTLLFRHPWAGFALAVILSISAEIVQLVIPGRTASLRDIVANGAGAAIGALIAWIVIVIRRRRPSPPPATTRAR